jgi:hypothetical protein
MGRKNKQNLSEEDRDYYLEDILSFGNLVPHCLLLVLKEEVMLVLELT